MIDASKIFTSQIAQNIMTEEDIQKVFELYLGYRDVIDKSKVVTKDEIIENGYSLSIDKYIERPKIEMLSIEEIRNNYVQAIKKVEKAENHLKRVLKEEGLVNE
jgi:type I restriction enzyme M protein